MGLQLKLNEALLLSVTPNSVKVNGPLGILHADPADLN
jgi:hypothetical protein